MARRKKKDKESTQPEPEQGSKSLDERHLELLLQIFELDREILVERELPMTIGVGERNVGITINPDFTWEWAPSLMAPTAPIDPFNDPLNGHHH